MLDEIIENLNDFFKVNGNVIFLGILAAGIGIGSENYLYHFGTMITPKIADGINTFQHYLCGFGEPVLAGSVPLSIYYFAKGALNIKDTPKLDLAVIGIIYTLFGAAEIHQAYRWETKQAFLDVYGGSPRGYIQYDQLYTQYLGTLSYLLLSSKNMLTFIKHEFKQNPLSISSS